MLVHTIGNPGRYASLMGLQNNDQSDGCVFLYNTLLLPTSYWVYQDNAQDNSLDNPQEKGVHFDKIIVTNTFDGSSPDFPSTSFLACVNATGSWKWVQRIAARSELKCLTVNNNGQIEAIGTQLHSSDTTPLIATIFRVIIDGNGNHFDLRDLPLSSPVDSSGVNSLTHLGSSLSFSTSTTLYWLPQSANTSEIYAWPLGITLNSQHSPCMTIDNHGYIYIFASYPIVAPTSDSSRSGQAQTSYLLGTRFKIS